MRRILSVLGFLSLCSRLSCAVFTTPVDDPFRYPCQIEGRYLDIGKTNFADGDLGEEKIALKQWSVQASHIHCICPATGLLVSGTYYDTTFDWINSPFFTQSHFPEVQIMVGAFTGLVPNWIWRGALGVAVQTQKWSLGQYGTFRGLLWGRYCVCKNLGFHAGVLFSRGLRATYVLPILGVDWQIKRYLRLDAVFPLDVALKWCPWNPVSFSLAGRWLRTRFRAGRDNPVPEGLFEFRTWGVEARASLTPTCCMGIDAFVGTTIWGWTRVENPTGTTLDYRDTKGAPYAGAEAYIRF